MASRLFFWAVKTKEELEDIERVVEERVGASEGLIDLGMNMAC